MITKNQFNILTIYSYKFFLVTGTFKIYSFSNFQMWPTGGKHKARGPNPALHFVLSRPASCFTQWQH